MPVQAFPAHSMATVPCLFAFKYIWFNTTQFLQIEEGICILIHACLQKQQRSKTPVLTQRSATTGVLCKNVIFSSKGGFIVGIFLARSYPPKSSLTFCFKKHISETFYWDAFAIFAGLAWLTSSLNASTRQFRQACSPAEFSAITKKYLGYPVRRHCLWGFPLAKKNLHCYYCCCWC